MLDVKKILTKISVEIKNLKDWFSSWLSTIKKLQNYGDFVEEQSTETHDIYNSIWSCTESITLKPGRWMIIGYVIFPNNSTGVRMACISNTSGASGSNATYSVAVPSGSMGLQVSLTIQIRIQTTYYLNVWQNSDSTLTIAAGNACLKAIKIPDQLEA